MVTKNSSILQASVISTLLLVSAISITQFSTKGPRLKGGKFTADLMPRSGSSASGTATLELQDNGQAVKYNIDATGLNNVTDIAISQRDRNRQSS